MHITSMKTKTYAEKMVEQAGFCIQNGILCWKSNGQVPFDDMLQDFQNLGIRFDMEKTKKFREKQVSKSIAAYKKSMENHQYSDEELFEMRAAFGSDAEVVNVITGKKIITK
jgi:hypothetical protein